MPVNSLIPSLSIGFNDIPFSRTYFKITNSPVIPLEGDGIRIQWEHYIEDKDLVSQLEEFENNNLFLAHIVSREFTKDEVITHLTLFEESDYNRNYEELK